MATDVKSKNLYELLGNTSDQDSDREPDPPTKAVDKTAPRHGKRDAPKPAPAAPADGVARATGGNRNGGFTGSEAAFRDRTTGRNRNREQPTEDGKPPRDAGATRSRGRGRGGPRRGGDRHSRTGISEHPKQEGHGWGEKTGEGELADETAGADIATQEIKGGGFDAGAQAEGWNENAEATTLPTEEAEAEPEDKSKSYAEYLAEQAAKKLEGLGLKEARAPNEGTKENKKWKNAKELAREEEDAYFVGEEKKAARERARKERNVLDLDHSWNEQAREATRGRGRGRGRGEFRGDRGGFRGDREDRGERGDRPDRPERGEFRGRGRGRGDRPDRGEFRGRGRGRGSSDVAGVAVNDESAFPSLGSK